ncbi:RUSC1 protein, partial [Mionectes macconnelli]|nr:RUSC1 protein [Mionectes macconnelli]
VLYSPTAFFALSQGPLPHLADELLLLIQPLSVLTFHLDLLFEHHHLSVDVRPLSRRLESPLSPPGHTVPARGAASPEGRGAAAGDSLEDETPPDGLGRVGGAGASTRARPQATMGGLVPAPPVGAALHQTLQHVLRWGDQLSRALWGAEGPPPSHGPEEGPGGTETGLSGWWGQLSQSSRIYSAPSKEKFPLVWWTKLRGTAGDPGPGQAVQAPTSLSKAGGTELQLLQTKTVPGRSGPKPSSSTDTSGDSSPRDLIPPTKPDDPTAGEKLLDLSPVPRASGTQAAPSGLALAGPGPDKGSWLGRLFGATSPSSRSFPPSPDTILARSRRPSHWLSPSPRVLAGVVKGLVPGRTRAQEQPERSTAPQAAQAPRAVRALCDHTGAADGHLSFQKGDILQLLSTVDEDWIRCCHGNSTGLVPVGYTSLIL